jgi:hypothetical protein
MYSINTLLLQVFSTLIVHNASFSVGDVVFEDEDNTLTEMLMNDQNCFRKFYDGDDMYELELKVPLTVQCKCAPCIHLSKPKTAICFFRIQKYLYITPQEYMSFSVWSILEKLRKGIFDDGTVGVPGCPVRSCEVTPYAHADADEIVVRTVVDRRYVEEDVKQLHTFNASCRKGNEFFVTKHFLENRRIFN